MLRALELADGPGTEADRAAAGRAVAQLLAWSRRRAGRRLASDGGDVPQGPARRHAARRLSALVAGLDRPTRVALASPIRAARDALARRSGVGFDRRLADLDAERDVGRWLEALVSAAPPAAPPAADDRDPGTSVGKVLILLVGERR